MTRKVQLVLQGVGVAGQILLPSVPHITPEWLQFGHAILAAAQALSAWIGHQFNPDGTPAKVAYEKE